ncbi:uncharacterized protein LOC131860240 [Cryptomeria japonica]|uniref:uncharacterized protein LOC131860240 n=1 Tax=Cryptomeria japonica TaxID=3369 RepID=UPI0027DA2539|nr:uncharacterized protein LOC131860240 [Cryptomeria japonica]
MASRLKKLLPHLILKNQNGFTPGRELADTIILVSKVMHSIHKEKSKGMIIKLDVAKANDRVVWQFLVKVLSCYGFPKEWIDCVSFCISTVSFSLLVNGAVCGFFKATNGLKQGDPLSPALFALMAEVLSNLIKTKQSAKHWNGVRVHRLIEPFAHSQFVDDTILFGEATMKEAKGIKEVLDEYSKLSGQVMNVDKLQFFFFNTGRLIQNRISQMLGFKIVDLPIKYMGIRINMGSRQSQIWKMYLTLVSSVGAKLDGLLKKFVWDGAKDHKKIPLINWDTMCMRKEDGGAGLRKMKRGSPTWNFLWNNRDIITNHISWKMGNGTRAKFWRDSWDGEMPLSKCFEDQVWFNTIENVISTQVANYFENTKHHGMRSWKRVTIDNSQMCKKLEEILSSRSILASDEEDNLFWCAAKLGEYSVKLGYEVQRHKAFNLNWPSKLCWNRCWDWFLGMVSLYTARSVTLKEFLVAWPRSSQSKWGVLWLIDLAIIVWSIWKERNKQIFKESSKPVELVIDNLKAGIEEVICEAIRDRLALEQSFEMRMGIWCLIEGDSQIIINGVTTGRLINWKLAKWLPHIRSLLQAIKPYEISHIHREGNRVADLLANLGVNSYAAEVSVDPKALSSEITDLCKKDLLIRKCDGVG